MFGINIGKRKRSRTVSAAAGDLSRHELNEIIRSNFPCDILVTDCVYIMRRFRSMRFPYRICNKQWKKSHFCSIPNTRASGNALKYTHPHPCKQYCAQEDRTHGSKPLLYVSTVDTDILEFHERRGERRRSDHKFRFPSRRETIRFHLAIYIRATVTYVRQI